MKNLNGEQKLAQQKYLAKLMEQDVKELELKARFWKAQLEIRKNTLEYDKLENEYNDYVTKQEKIRKELEQKKEETLKTLQEELAKTSGVPLESMSSPTLETIK